MSISYNKNVITAVQTHILTYFDDEHEFVSEVKHIKNAFNTFSVYHTLKQMAEEGTFLCYINDMKKFIQEAFQQSDEDATKYSTDKVVKMYCHLIARDGSKLFDKLN